jgi:hypothetical protein
MPSAALDSPRTCKEQPIVQKTSSVETASPIPTPALDIDEPVALIPIASVAPLDGPPDGERVAIFAIAEKHDARRADLRSRVVSRPLSHVAAAFALGFVIARVLR